MSHVIALHFVPELPPTPPAAVLPLPTPRVKSPFPEVTKYVYVKRGNWIRRGYTTAGEWVESLILLAGAHADLIAQLEVQAAPIAA